MRYQWLIREPIHAPLDIVLRRLPDSVSVSVQEVIAGGGVAKSGERRNADLAGLLVIAQHSELQFSFFECVRNLPDAVLALGIEARSVSIYWHEEAAVPRSADEKGRLADGKNLIEDLRGRLQTWHGNRPDLWRARQCALVNASVGGSVHFHRGAVDSDKFVTKWRDS